MSLFFFFVTDKPMGTSLLQFPLLVKYLDLNMPYSRSIQQIQMYDLQNDKISNLFFKVETSFSKLIL